MFKAVTSTNVLRKLAFLSGGGLLFGTHALAAPTVNCAEDQSINARTQEVYECSTPNIGPWKAHLADLGSMTPGVDFIHDAPGQVPDWISTFIQMQLKKGVCSYSPHLSQVVLGYMDGVVYAIDYPGATEDHVVSSTGPGSCDFAGSGPVSFADRRDVRCATGWRAYGDSSDQTNGGCYRVRTVPARASGGTCNASVPFVGNPIEVYRSVKIQTENDYQYSTTPLLNFTRYYSSATFYSARRQERSWQTISPHWRHTWSRRLDLVSGLAGNKVVVTLGKR